MGGGPGTSQSVAGKGGVLGTRACVARQEGGGYIRPLAERAP
jgi:hypothetical protein